MPVCRPHAHHVPPTRMPATPFRPLRRFESLVALNTLGFLVPSSNLVAMLVRNNVRYSGHNRGAMPKSSATDWHTTLPCHTEAHVYCDGNLFSRFRSLLYSCTVGHLYRTNPEFSYSRLVKENMRPVGPTSSLRTVEQNPTEHLCSVVPQPSYQLL
jgi:hypothetical protein